MSSGLALAFIGACMQGWRQDASCGVEAVLATNVSLVLIIWFLIIEYSRLEQFTLPDAGNCLTSRSLYLNGLACKLRALAACDASCNPCHDVSARGA
eukprot:2666859-Pleurochrysis_carterae.AAC.1